MANVKKVKRKPVYVTLDKQRELKYDLNAFAEMEDRYGTVDEAMAVLEAGSIKGIRFILWCGLMHEEDALTEQEVGKYVELTDLEEIANKMNQVMDIDLPSSSGDSGPNV